VLRDQHFSKRESRYFDGATYIATDTYQNRFVYPGMIVALDSDSGKYVPYNASASYGTGSDTAIGVLHEFYDMTYDDRIVEPVWHGILIEDHCYIYVGAVGTVTSAVKTALDDIIWV
jgi:hypothetical protein